MATTQQQQALAYEQAVYRAALAYQAQHPVMPPSAPPLPGPAPTIASIQATATQRMLASGPDLPGAQVGPQERVRTLYGLSPTTNYAANEVAVSPNVMWAAGYQLSTNSLGHQYWIAPGGFIADTVTTLLTGGQQDSYTYWNP